MGLAPAGACTSGVVGGAHGSGVALLSSGHVLVDGVTRGARRASFDMRPGDVVGMLARRDRAIGLRVYFAVNGVALRLGANCSLVPVVAAHLGAESSAPLLPTSSFERGAGSSVECCLAAHELEYCPYVTFNLGLGRSAGQSAVDNGLELLLRSFEDGFRSAKGGNVRTLDGMPI